MSHTCQYVMCTVHVCVCVLSRWLNLPLFHSSCTVMLVLHSISCWNFSKMMFNGMLNTCSLGLMCNESKAVSAQYVMMKWTWQVESVGDDDEKSRFLQSSKSSRSTESGHLNPETRARLRALLESTGLLQHFNTVLQQPNFAWWSN